MTETNTRRAAKRELMDCLADLPDVRRALRHAANTLEDCARANNNGVAQMHGRYHKILDDLLREYDGEQ